MKRYAGALQIFIFIYISLLFFTILQPFESHDDNGISEGEVDSMDAEMRGKIRSWVTPLTVAVFLMLAITGFVMEGHQRGLSGLHQVLGYSFCAIALAHVALNWQVMVAQMKTSKAMAVIVMVCALGSLLWLGAKNGPQGERRTQGERHGRWSDQDSRRSSNRDSIPSGQEKRYQAD